MGIHNYYIEHVFTSDDKINNLKGMKDVKFLLWISKSYVIL